jgi:hypothetical protein
VAPIAPILAAVAQVLAPIPPILTAIGPVLDAIDDRRPACGLRRGDDGTREDETYDQCSDSSTHLHLLCLVSAGRTREAAPPPRPTLR